MDKLGGEKPACPCSKECKEFQKLLELKNSGLVVYLHRPRADDGCTPSMIRQGEPVGGAVNPSEDVFIIYNNKNMKITTSELTSEFEKKNISCPRCRKTFEHAQELMQDVESIDKKIVMGICDHCRKKSQTTKKLFCDCDQIVKKFMYVKGEKKEDTKKFAKKLFPPEIGFLRTRTTLKKQKKTRTYSDLQINLGLSSPSRHDLEVKPMFYSHTDLKSDKTEISETDSREFYRKQAVTFIQPIEPHEGVHARTPAPSLVESETSLMETYKEVKEFPRPSLKDHKREEIFVDIPSLDAKEALKRRHDLSLRQMMILDKDTGGPHSVSKRPVVYETPKISPWEQLETISKYHVGSKTDINKIPTPTKTKSKQDYSARDRDDLNRQLQFRSLRTSQRNVQDSYFELSKFDKNDHDKILKKEESKIQRSVDKISRKMKKTKQDVSESESLGTVSSVLKPDFSFSFPTVKEKKTKKIKVSVKTSSDLLKDVQEKYVVEAEKEKEKLEEALKKKLAREQEKLQAEEKKRQALEDKKNQALQNKKAEEQKILTEKDKSKELESEIDGEPAVAKEDTKSISTRQRKPSRSGKKKADDEEAKGDNKADDREAKRKKIADDREAKGKKIADDSDAKGKKIADDGEAKGKKKTDDREAKREKKADDREAKRKKIADDREAKRKKIADDREVKGKKIADDGKAKGKKKADDGEAKREKKGDDGEAKRKKIADDREAKGKKKADDGEAKREKKADDGEAKRKKIADDREAKGKKIADDEEANGKKKADDGEPKGKKKADDGEAKRKKIADDREAKGKKIADDEEANGKKKADDGEAKGKKRADDGEAKTKKGIEKNPKPEEKGDDREAESDAEDLGTKQKEKTQIGKGAESDLNKKAEHDKILQKKERQMEAPEKQITKGKELMKKEKDHATPKKEKQENETGKSSMKEREGMRREKEERQKAKIGELEMGKIKIEKTDSYEILKLVTIKQTKPKMKPSDVHLEYIKRHRCHHQQSGQYSLLCPLCLDSELELDVLSIEAKKTSPKQNTEIIIGDNILKCRPRVEKTKKLEGVPIFFQKDFVAEPDHRTEEEVQIIPEKTKPVQNKQILGTVEVEPAKGVIRYALSDRTFIDKGWTMLPTEKVVRKMNVYRMRPARPEFDWFEHNKNKGLMTYDTGERLAEFDNNGRGCWYYRSGRLALDYYDAEETNAQQRFVVYSSGEPDERGRTHPITILATFDYLGNGIVFDHAGKIRLKYNQTEGVVLDRGIGPVSHWKWHTLNDPPVLQQVMIDTQMAHKDPHILKLGPKSEMCNQPDNEEMLAIEFDNFIKEKSKKLSQKFKPFQIKMKALKINEHFSLKVLDQATVYLIFRDGSTNLKLNIGMILDHQEIVDTDTAEVGEVSNSLERFPARTDSLAGLQRSVAYAQRYERQRSNRERRLLPTAPCASADQLTAAASPPLRLPLRTVPTGSSSTTGRCSGYCSRKPTNNLYYNTRLL